MGCRHAALAVGVLMSLALRVYVDDTADAIVSRVRRPGAASGWSTPATLSTGLSGVGSPHVAVGEDNEAFAVDNDESNPLAGGGEPGGSGAVPTATPTAKPTRKAATGCKKAGRKLANTNKQVKKAKKRSERAKPVKREACG